MKSILVGTIVLALSSFGCQKSPKSGDGVASAAVSAAPPPSAPEAPPKPWYEGRWSGTYQAALERIELPVGGVRAWKDDDGTAASGAGTLSVSVSPDGMATGEADGPLGAQVVSGHADEKGIRLTLAPKSDDDKAFRGTLIAERAGETVAGSLRASSGDSLTVRKATVELRPVPPAP